MKHQEFENLIDKETVFVVDIFRNIPKLAIRKGYILVEEQGHWKDFRTIIIDGGPKIRQPAEIFRTYKAALQDGLRILAENHIRGILTIPTADNLHYIGDQSAREILVLQKEIKRAIRKELHRMLRYKNSSRIAKRYKGIYNLSES